jgi:hypothetical protein
MVLSAREKLLIAFLLVFMIGMVLFYGVQGFRDMEEELQNRISTQESYLHRAMAIIGELEKLERLPQRRVRSRSLIGFVEQLANKINLKDRIQLNLIPKDNRSGLQGLNIKVDGLTLDEMVDLIYALESAEMPLMIQQFEMNPSFRNRDLLRLTLRVLARS